MPGFCQTVIALLALLHLRLFPRPFSKHAKVCSGGVGPDGASTGYRVFVLLSMLSDEIYLRLKLYLVVKISPDIVTEHCYQVCVLSMMFCRSDCRLCADIVVSDCAIGKLLAVPRGLTLQQANVGYGKYCLHLIFSFHLDRDILLELFPVVFQWKRFSVLTAHAGLAIRQPWSIIVVNQRQKLSNYSSQTQ